MSSPDCSLKFSFIKVYLLFPSEYLTGILACTWLKPNSLFFPPNPLLLYHYWLSFVFSKCRTYLDFSLLHSLYTIHYKQDVSSNIPQIHPLPSILFEPCILFFCLNYYSSLIFFDPVSILLQLAHLLCTRHTVLSTLKYSKLPHIKLFPLPAMLFPQIFPWLVSFMLSRYQCKCHIPEIFLTT